MFQRAFIIIIHLTHLSTPLLNLNRSDVRNAYESDIGHFNPPEGGAKLLDPKMRTSADFPKWLNAPETKAQLKDKTVMMYCEYILFLLLSMMNLFVV